MKVYFKNLDGIRFFAAFMVLVHHSFYFKRGYSDAFPFVEGCFEHTGRLGVNLFFILSGFLISYLLLVEKDSTGTISYRKFYMRRILRIWPLYLGYGLVLTFFSPYVAMKLGLGGGTDWGTMLLNMVFLLLFAVNFQLAFVGENQGIFEVSWSVCIEEQFYLIWPPLVNIFRKRLNVLLAGMFILSFLSRVLLYFILPQFRAPVPSNQYLNINYLMLPDKLDLFGGGLFIAVLYYNYKQGAYQSLFKRLFHPGVQWIMTLLALGYTISLVKPDSMLFLMFGDHYICDVLYGYILLAAVAENSIYRLEHPLLKVLGKISFGVYLFHTAICQFVLVFLRKFVGHPESHILYDIIYPLLNTVVTCSIAYLSYTYYERWFLLRKKKFELVTTRM